MVLKQLIETGHMCVRGGVLARHNKDRDGRSERPGEFECNQDLRCKDMRAPIHNRTRRTSFQLGMDLRSREAHLRVREWLD
jgi:hypothetical protein